MKNKYEKGTRISERKYRSILKLFSEDIPALNVSRLIGINYRSVHRLYTLWRFRIAYLALEEMRPLSGEIEVDESYFGPSRIRGKRGRGAGRKIPVLGLHKRGDRVFVSVVKNCSQAELMPILKGRILDQSDVYTDGWKAYDGVLMKGFQHHRIHHHQNEFARGNNHINGIESFWSYAKFRLAKLRGIRRDFFFLHLKECEWRFNHRRDNIYQLLLAHFRKNPLSTT